MQEETSRNGEESAGWLSPAQGRLQPVQQEAGGQKIFLATPNPLGCVRGGGLLKVRLSTSPGKPGQAGLGGGL